MLTKTDLAVYETLKSEYVRYVRYKAGDKNMQVEIGTFVPLCCGMISRYESLSLLMDI